MSPRFEGKDLKNEIKKNRKLFRLRLMLNSSQTMNDEQIVYLKLNAAINYHNIFFLPLPLPLHGSSNH